MFNRSFKFEGLMVWVTITGVILMGLSILIIAVLESEIIQRAGAHNRKAAFVLLSRSVSTMISQAGGIKDTAALEGLVHEIVEIRPRILRLSIFQVTSESSSLIVSTDTESVPKTLDPFEQAEILAGRTVMQLDESKGERAWLIAAPITIEGKIIGALRGLFSVKEYDELIKQEIEAARAIGIAILIITSVTFLLLIRVKVHHPIHQVLQAMRQVESGNLLTNAPVGGPSEIQEIAVQFNRMIDHVRKSDAEKDLLLGEVQRFNDTLQKRVLEAAQELQRTNLELVEARLTAERSQQLAALGELSATVAHELGNPLNALSGHLQLLTEDDDGAGSRERHLSIIRSEVDRMVTIIRQLLAQTQIRLRSVPVDLNITIREVLALLSAGFLRQFITVKVDLQNDLPHVAGDPRALHGLLFNLIINAKQAMPSGGDLTIRTQASSEAELLGLVIVKERGPTEGTTVRLTIADTGKGIPPEHLTRIFEPFFTTRRDEGGTGLGLAVCYRVVTDSGGRLSVQSRVGQGTEFTVDLPVWNGEWDARGRS